MWKAAKTNDQGKEMMDSTPGLEFVEAMFGRDRELGKIGS
jgi:hypothetical protein